MIVTEELKKRLRLAIEQAEYTDYMRGEDDSDDEISFQTIDINSALEAIIEIIETL
jgi:hypothetical protein